MNLDDFSEDGLRESARKTGVPEHIRDGLIRYVRTGCPVGDFLTAVLSNDLKYAVLKADEKNRHALREIILWLINYTPSGCHGDAGSVPYWHGMGGYVGLMACEILPDGGEF